jgi:hypothetical protein
LAALASLAASIGHLRIIHKQHQRAALEASIGSISCIHQQHTLAALAGLEFIGSNPLAAFSVSIGSISIIDIIGTIHYHPLAYNKHPLVALAAYIGSIHRHLLVGLASSIDNIGSIHWQLT